MTPKDKLVEEARNFCKRVEAGEVRSKRTYAAFKALLAQIDGVQGICPRSGRACEGGCGLGRLCGHLSDNFIALAEGPRPTTISPGASNRNDRLRR